MWTVVYIAQSAQIAEQIRALLEANELLVKIRPIAKKAENADGSYEILVPESEVTQAHALIIDANF